MTALNSDLGLFALLVAGIIALPGMDMALIAGKALTEGKKAGWAATLGVTLGGVVHVGAAALGLGWLIQLHPAIYRAVLLAGALYMAYLGWGLWRSAATAPAPASVAADNQPQPVTTPASSSIQGSLWRTALQGWVTCLLNPKAYLFMLAVFPQFVQPQAGSMLMQALPMGAIIAATQVVIYGSLVQSATLLSKGARAGASAPPMMMRGVGLMLMLMALWAIYAGWT